MIYKVNEEKNQSKYKDSYKTQELMYEWPPNGFQAEKIDRQAVKWLSPKYCYAFDSVGTTVTTGNTWTIALDTYSTNDLRMSATPGRIIVPQAWLWIIKALVRKSSVYAGTCNIYILRNWSSLIDTSSAFYEEIDMKTNTDWPTTNLCVPLYLDQNDYIQIWITNNSGASCVYTALYSTLRLQSYVLY